MTSVTGDADLESLTRLFQLAILPVVLISAISLLMLTVSNRLGRVIDRGRALIPQAGEVRGGNARGQLSVILRRAAYLRASACCLVGGIFCSGLLILFLYLRGIGLSVMETAARVTFLADIVALLGGAGFLLADVLLSLKALRLQASSADAGKLPLVR
jgi:Protein of unknown function (DUF2721)